MRGSRVQMDDLESQPESHASINAALYQALSDANRLFATAKDQPLSEIFKTLSSLLVDRLDLQLVWIGILPKGKEWIEPISSSGVASEYPEGIRITIRDDLVEGQGPIGYALRTGRVFRIDVTDAVFEPWRVRADAYRLGGGIALPFLFPNGDKGVVALYRRRGKSFLIHIEDLLERLGEDLTVFLRHRREIEELGRLISYQKAIGALLHDLMSVLDPMTVYKEVTRILIEITDALGAWISVPADGRWLQTVAGDCKAHVPELADAIWNFYVPLQPDGTQLSDSSAANAFRKRRAIIINDESEGSLAHLKEAFPSLRSVRVAGSCPVLAEGDPIAILVMVSEDPGYFSGPLVALIEQLIDGICLAVNNYKIQGELRRRTQLYKALLAEGGLLFTAQNEEDFLGQTCQRLIESGLFNSVWIGKPARGLGLERLASAGENVDDLDVIPSIAASNPSAQTVSMRAFLQRETVYVADYLNDPNSAHWRHLSEINHWRSVVSLPISRSDVVWGVFTIISDQVDGFSPELIELLTQTSQIISHGLDEIDLRAELNAERERQSWLASHDVLTGLPNRRGLEEHIANSMARSSRHGTILAVGMLDLDDFKALNDEYGHKVGDQILQEFSMSLKANLRQTDLLARVGGDEFVIVIEDLRDLSDLITVLNKLEKVLVSPLVGPRGERLSVGGSLGISIFAGDESQPEALLRQSDQALYTLKRKKSSRVKNWAFYAPNDPEGISNFPYFTLPAIDLPRQNLYQSLLHGGALRVFYQPILNLITDQVVGAEALARLVNPKGEFLLPSEFLSSFNFSDQRFLTRELLSIVRADLSSLEKDGVTIWASINVLPELLAADDFLGHLKEEFSEGAIAPSRITLEVLEGSNFLSMDDAWQRLVALKELGVDLAIDDIGSAYSSLLRLRDLPIDKIKLDQEFVRNLSFQPNGFHFLNAMADLARGLRVDFIAEGAETEEILDALVTLGVPFAQGYAIAHPMQLSDFRNWISTYGPVPHDEHPNSQLGLYAFHLRQTLSHHQRLASGLPMGTVDECKLQAHLERLGYANTEIDFSHHAYHEALTRYEKASLQKPNPELRGLEEARENLRISILTTLRRDR